MANQRPAARVMTQIRPAKLYFIAVVLLALPGPGLEAQTAAVSGRLVDRASGLPVSDAFVALDSTNHATYSDQDGRFRFEDVDAGTYAMRIRHIAYGNQALPLELEAGKDITVQFSVSQTAIELEPILLEVLSRDDLRERAAGFSSSIVRREDLARLEHTSLNIGDVLRMHAPGVKVRRFSGLPGQPVCIELRVSPRSSPGECMSPAVYMDGVPILDPETLYGHLNLSDLERLEIIPAVEAGARYGSGALHGALLIETRRPGRSGGDEPEVPGDGAGLLTNFDWSQEPGTHSTKKVYAYSVLGGAVGLGLGVLVADQCLGLRSPSFDSVITDCGGFPTMSAAVAALALPAIGSALAARWAGGTDASRGKLVPATLGASMVLIPGYALVLSGQRSDTGPGPVQWTGNLVLALGAPFAVALADKLYRSLRND